MTKGEPSTIQQRFGKAVRRRRRELDITQEDLAGRANLHRTFISEIERGETNPSLEIVERLTQALEISISNFFSIYRIDISFEDSAKQ